MWERTDRSARPARAFAQEHGLVYSDAVSPESARGVDAAPFAGVPLRHHVSGQWRGRLVQRFEAGRFAVELMALPQTVPTVRILPSDLDWEAPTIGAATVATGDTAFDRRWSVIADNEHFAVALLTPAMREALMHPAAQGRAVTFGSDHVSSWAQDDTAWSDARMRLDFLAVLVGRIDADVWQRFSISAPAPLAGHTVWTPAPEQPEEAQWLVAPLPKAPEKQHYDSLTDTGEFEVALFNTQLDGAAFIPQPEHAHDDQASWLVAPIIR